MRKTPWKVYARESPEDGTNVAVMLQDGRIFECHYGGEKFTYGYDEYANESLHLSNSKVKMWAYSDGKVINS